MDRRGGCRSGLRSGCQAVWSERRAARRRRCRCPQALRRLARAYHPFERGHVACPDRAARYRGRARRVGPGGPLSVAGRAGSGAGWLVPSFAPRWRSRPGRTGGAWGACLAAVSGPLCVCRPGANRPLGPGVAPRLCSPRDTTSCPSNRRRFKARLFPVPRRVALGQVLALVVVPLAAGEPQLPP